MRVLIAWENTNSDVGKSVKPVVVETLITVKNPAITMDGKLE